MGYGSFGNRTFSPKKEEIRKDWFVVDASNKILGRLASEIAQVLRGKHKPSYATHMDTGDFVIVVNAEKVKLTGRKPQQKVYYRHTTYPHGFKEEKYLSLLARKPEEIIRHAVWGMLPKNSLGRSLMKKLRIFRGPEHIHSAQQPKKLELGKELN